MLKKGILILLALIMAAFPMTVYANTRTTGGEMPGYARIEHGFAIHTGEWAAIVFYRPTECVPPTFNLLDFYDFEHFMDCGPSTVDGFYIWSGEPWLTTPLEIKLFGLGAVPVWFTSWMDLEAAMMDESLTMQELEAIPSLIRGTANIYTEVLVPTADIPDLRRPAMINFVALGSLEDSREFSVHVVAVRNLTPQHVDISFR